MISQNLIDQLIYDESCMHHLYKDTVGKNTIGIGRNLDDNGINHEEALFMLNNDLQHTYNELKVAFPWFEQLSIIRASVMMNMCFNMGLVVFGTFKKTLKYIRTSQYEFAATEMLDSKWARQVGKRALRLSEQMRSNKWQKKI